MVLCDGMNAAMCALTRSQKVADLSNMRCMGVPCFRVTLGKMMLHFAMRAPLPGLPAVSVPYGANKFAASMNCLKDASLFDCVFGNTTKEDQIHCRSRYCPECARYDRVRYNRTETGLAFLRFYFFFVPQIVPRTADCNTYKPNRILTVHVRGGDACNIVSYERLDTRYLHGMWVHANVSSWWDQRRVCVHASYYVRVAKRLIRTHSFERVELLTDEPTAILAFTQDPQLSTVTSFVRRDMSDFVPTSNNTHGWYDFKKMSPTFMMSAVEDVRRASKGTFLLASMCSMYASLIYNAMVVFHAITLPFESVDSCSPYLAPWTNAHPVTNETVKDLRVRMHEGLIMLDRPDFIPSSR